MSYFNSAKERMCNMKDGMHPTGHVLLRVDERMHMQHGRWHATGHVFDSTKGCMCNVKSGIHPMGLVLIKLNKRMHVQREGLKDRMQKKNGSSTGQKNACMI